MAGRRLVISLVVIAILVASVIALRNNAWGAIFAGLLGGLLVSGIFAWPKKPEPDELDLLEPIGFEQGEGNWQVRLDTYGQPKVLTVLSRSFDTSLTSAVPMITDLPKVLIRHATEEHARELVERLHRAGATAEALGPSA